MCGIAGLIVAEGAAREEAIRAMCDAMVHRGPDDSGLYLDGPVALGHRRLSIIDLASGQQPITSADGRATIVFNGEIYNYRALRRELLDAGHRFSTNGDAETILNLYLEMGERCVSRLRGMFAFAIWDREAQTLFAAVDRVGIKPLHYALDEDRCALGSELKTVLASGLVDRRLDPQAVDDFFAYGFIRAPRSVYAQVSKLEAGHTLTVTTGATGRLEAKTRRYWRLPPRRVDPTLSYEDAKAELERLLLDAVRVRLMSEVPLGAFLSGGIDSSTVVWLMSRVSERPVDTFSIGFDEERFTELPFARAIAKRFGTNHEEEIVTPDAIAVLPEVIAGHDEPFGDPSSIPTWYVSRMARKHVTVCLSGDGGDELFAGYSRYVTLAREQRLVSRLPGPVRALLSQSRRLFPIENRTFNQLRRVALSPQGRYALFRTNFHEGMRARLFSPAFRREIDTALTADLFSDTNGEFTREDGLSALMASDFGNYLPYDVLTKVDRMSMAHSLEARVPLLDHAVAEFAQTLPLEFLYEGGRTKRILRDVIEPHFPREVLEHRKQGFSVPLKAWFAGDLKPTLEQALESPVYRSSGMFDPGYVRRIYRLHRSGRADMSWQLWQLLVFARWHEQMEL